MVEYIVCVNIHWTHVTAKSTNNNIHWTHVTAKSTNNNAVSFFVSDLKILYYNNY